jgi:alpha-glucosidase
MLFNFGLIGAEWSPAGIRDIADGIAGVVSPGGRPSNVVGNHDEHRVATRIGTQQIRLAQLLVLTLQGTPTLYYGDEIGMVDGDIPACDAQDPWERGGAGAWVRQGSRANSDALGQWAWC